MQIGILGSGYYLPELTVTNEELSHIVDTSDEWIRSRSGIASRHYANGENCWEMGVAAARRALQDAGVEAAQLDGIIFTSTTPDYFTPAMASFVQKALGAEHAFAFDMNVACSGFIYALDLASRYLQDPDMRYILVVSSEAMSHIIDFEDRTTCVLFGDGAGAVLVGKQGSELLASVLRTKTELIAALSCRALDEVTHPFGQDSRTPVLRMPNERHKLYMSGSEVYRYAVQELIDLAQTACDKAGIAVQDIDLYVPHQANQRIIHAAAKHSEIPEDRVVVMLEDTGNLSSASIPYCLSRLNEQGRLHKGDLILICAFGSGLSSGAILLRW